MKIKIGCALQKSVPKDRKEFYGSGSIRPKTISALLTIICASVRIDFAGTPPLWTPIYLSVLSRSFSDHHLRCGGWLNIETGPDSLVVRASASGAVCRGFVPQSRHTKSVVSCKSRLRTCGLCDDSFGWEDRGICCDTCNFWYHIDCQGMSPTKYSIYNRSLGKSIAWECMMCGMPNFSTSLFDTTASLEVSNRIETLSSLSELDSPVPDNIASPPSSFFAHCAAGKRS